ncbi:predicted protein [Enterococcus faecalis JH1]|nr:predicted protein [Enterococcus faecalis ATCC 4200]EEU73897.1 predicted protein [Enterococcus faecalis JH1]EEU89331.1 predicted protein [Enterococcus faecalis ARO1/DG]
MFKSSPCGIKPKFSKNRKTIFENPFLILGADHFLTAFSLDKFKWIRGNRRD